MLLDRPAPIVSWQLHSIVGPGRLFVAKFSPTGQLLFSTRIGGGGFDEAFGIAVDQNGNVYVTGQTGSPDFPVVNGFQTSFGGGFSDAFVVKLNASGTIVYSSYLGGSGGDEFARAIAVDSSGNAYVAGKTNSTDFPVENAAQPVYGGGSSDAFVAKINTNAVGAASLVYSTFLGGNGFESGNAIAVDQGGNAYAAGGAECCFPTTSDAFQPFIGNGFSHVFLVKFGPSGSVMYSTLIGGSKSDVARSIAVDRSGKAYVVGETGSADFPTSAQPFQATNRGIINAFLTKLDPSVPGSAGLVYSTYLGGETFDSTTIAIDSAAAVAVDSAGLVYVVGRADSLSFPTKNPIQANNGGGSDAFLLQLDPAVAGPEGLLFGTYLGGAQHDEALGIATAPDGRVALTGFTESGNFPVFQAFQGFSGGSLDAFVAYMTFDTTPPTLSVPSNTVLNATSPAGAIFSFTATATDSLDPNPVIACTPPTGSTFPIGTTVVSCSATDASGNSSTASFQVTAEGAAQQISDLAAYVASLNLPSGLANSLESKLNSALQDPISGSCADLSDFVNQVSAQSGKVIPPSQAATLKQSAMRIKAVLGCR
jgi:HYR domain/Beta-propeller repeat